MGEPDGVNPSAAPIPCPVGAKRKSRVAGATGGFKKRIDMNFFLCVIGMVMIIEGIPYFAFPDKMKLWVQKVIEMPDLQLRRTGLILMGLGLFLVYLGKR